MPPRATCSFEISFSPTAVGPAEAFATITDDAPGSPHVLSVVGIGSGALAVVSTSSLSFGNQPQGSISPAKTVTLFNQGNQPLTVTNVAPAGPDLLLQFLADSLRRASRTVHRVAVSMAWPNLLQPSLHDHGQPPRVGDEPENGDFLPESLADSQRGVISGVDPAKVAAPEPSQLRNGVANRSFVPEFRADSQGTVRGGINSVEHHGQLRQLCNEVENRNFARELRADDHQNVRGGMNSVEHHGQLRQLCNEIENGEFAPESLADSHRGVKGGANSTEFTVTEPAPPRSLRQSRHPKPATRRTPDQQTLGLHLNTSLAAATALAISLTLLTLSCGAPHSTTQSTATPPGTYLLTLIPTSPQTSPPPTVSLALTVH
jgi:hypothetical protein